MSSQLEATLARAEAAPADVHAQIAAAYALDREGHEEAAAAFYDAALQLGVPPEARSEFLVGYGSTLRNVGRLGESERILRERLAEEPANHAARCFLALTLHDAGRHDEALALVLDVALDLRSGSPTLTRYEKALSSYRDLLRK